MLLRGIYGFLVGGLSLGGLVLPTLLKAQESLVSVAQDAPRKKSLVSGEVAASGQRNFYSQDDAAYDSSALLEAQLGLALSQRFKLGLQGGFSKQLVDDEKFEATDSALKLSAKTGSLHKGFDSAMGLSALLPTSKDSRENRSTYTVLSLSPGLALDLSEVGIPRFSVDLGMSFGLGFYKYKTAASGSSNKAWAQKNFLSLTYGVLKFLELSASFAQANAWTYEGDIVQSFETEQSLQLLLPLKTRLAVGHRNGGNVLKPNGQDSNIEVFNGNSSVIFSTLAVGF